MRAVLALAAAVAALTGNAGAQEAKVCADCVLAHIAYLAAPERSGRQCASADEAAAADYLAGQLRANGARGALADGGFVQTAPLGGLGYAAPPTLEAGAVKLKFGEAFIGAELLSSASGPLVWVGDAAQPPADLAGAIVLYVPDGAIDPAAMASLQSTGAAVVLVAAPPGLDHHWSALAARMPARVLAGSPDVPTPKDRTQVIFLKPEAVWALRRLSPGVQVQLIAETAPYSGATHNVLGVIHGSAPDADHHAVLLSAHYDHLGVLEGQLYPGANDDASGTAAVLEFARVLAGGPQPKRTVYFALFGCEEFGGYGAAWYRAHPPGGRLEDLAANLEFEMIGFADPKRPDALMLTGWERSNLGPALAAHGAKLGPDLYPEGDFFRRSDNYALAEKGVVAHTISAWPTPPTYHDPSDTYASLDKTFAVGMIASLIGPVRWLVDGDFTPNWNPGGRP